MSVHILSAVWRESKATGACLLVLLSLADQADDDGVCWPSVANIAARCRVGERSVHRYLNELVDLGEVTKEERPGQSSRYRVHPCQSGTPANLAPLPKTPPTPANLAPTSATVGRQNRQETKNHQETSAIASDPDNDPRPEVKDLCDHLASWISRNGNKTPVVTKRWYRACRLLIDVDGRTPEQIRTAIDWSQRHPFWSGNILSMQKLREKYDTLRIQAKQEGAASPRHLQAVPVPAYRTPPAPEREALPAW